MTMISRERVRTALRHHQPDRCPVDFGGTAMSQCLPEFLAKMRATLGFPMPPDREAHDDWADERILRYLEVDLRLVPDRPPLPVLRDLDPEACTRAIADKQRQREEAAAGVRTPGVSHAFPLANATLDELKKMPAQAPREPSPYLDWQIAVARRFHAEGFATTYWVSSGFFEMGCWNRGYDQFAVDLLTEPDIVAALFDRWLQENLGWVETVVKPLAPYIDIFCFGDDWGLQTGPFVSPATFRERVTPYTAAYYRAVRAAAPDAFIFHHSCGSVYRLLEDIIACGVDILNPIQPSAADMEAEKLRAKAAGRLSFHGGMDLQRLLPFGTPAEVRAEATRRQRVLGDGGGYICAPAHSLPSDVPVENILALFGKA